MVILSGQRGGRGEPPTEKVSKAGGTGFATEGSLNRKGAGVGTIGQQLSIPQLKAHMSQSRGAIGMAGELLLARCLEQRGYSVNTDHRRGDLKVILPSGEILGIEVKTARKNKDGDYHFTLYKHWQGRLCTDARHADIVALLCIMKTGDAVPFILPVTAAGDRKAVAICGYPMSYKGWLAPYRQTLRSLQLEFGRG